MYDVITVGSGVIDCFIDTGDRLFQKEKDNHIKVPFGTKIAVEKLRMETGGGGTNTAVSFSRLGLKSAWLGKTGTGQNSERIIKELKKENVDTSLVCRTSKGRAGFSVILDAKGHDRTILTYKGSNDNLEWDEINKKKISAKWIYCSSMAGKSYKTLEKIVGLASKKGIKIAFNPSSYLAVKGAKYLSGIISRTSLLVMNNEEAEDITGKKNAKEQLVQLSSIGPEIVVITAGSKGCSAYDRKKFYHLKPHKVKVAEATGAGDSFASGFLAGMIRTGDIELSLRIGLANAESVIMHFGAKNRLLTWNEALKKAKY